MFIDSHCHLDFPGLCDNLQQTMQAMQEAGVGGALSIGVNLEDWPQVYKIVETYPNLFASVGVHPEYRDAREPDVEELCRLAALPKVVAIGETGLDYYWHKENAENTENDGAGSLDWQRERFRVHIRAAKRLGKPLIIHTREAAADTLRLMREEGADAVGGVMHCFTESWDVARQALDLGFYISFSGIVSFKNAKIVHDTAQKVPNDRYLIETDAPYLAPVPYRGKPNQPAYVRHVAEALAALRGVSLETIGEQSTQNFFSLFPDCRAAF